MFLEACGVDLSKVVRLGGHSAPRTRSNPAGPNVGFALIKAISTKVKELPNVQFIYHAKVRPVKGTGPFAVGSVAFWRLKQPGLKCFGITIHSS